MIANDDIVLSCIQPTAEMHIGNYFGAIANWVKLQSSHRCIFGIVDLHAMTMPYDPAVLRQNTERMTIDLIACGIDPNESLLFIQSHVPEHLELFWILNCLCPYGELTRMTQFKDKGGLLRKKASNEFVSSGLFVYPVLQAADILVYRAKYVPVGKDQEQHLEHARNMAQRFNNQFGQFFPEPKPLFTTTPRIMSLADPSKKMSKSLGEKHFIGVFEKEKSIREKVKAAVTDSGFIPPNVEMSPGVSNLFEILKACGKTDEASTLFAQQRQKTLKYSELKAVVAECLIEMATGLRERREMLMRDSKRVREQVLALSEQTRQLAEITLKTVRSMVGIS